MRPLEALVLLAILLSLPAYLVPRRRRPRWFFLLPLLSALLVAIHLLLEGYRWQMVPAYALAAVVVVVMARGIRQETVTQPGAPSRRRSITIILGVALGLLVLAATAALLSILPVFNLPEPTGPFAVGTRYYYWTDEDRPDDFTSDPGDFREVSAQIWYPAELSGDEASIPYMRREAARAFTRFQGLPVFLLDHFTLVDTHAYLGAGAARTGAPFPVITYSASGLMSSHMTLFEELASRGYVVVCIGHPHWNPFVYGSDGEVLPFDRQYEQYQAWWAEADSEVVLRAKSQVSQARTTAVQERAESRLNAVSPLALHDLRLWAGDIGFVLDQLAMMNQGGGFLDGVLDMERVGIMGFSKGGAAAGQFCATDARCKTGINLTGFMYGDILDTPLRMPFLFVSEEELWCPDCFVNDLFYKRSESDAYQMKIRGARHTSFGDLSLYGWLIKLANDEPAIASERVIEIQNVYSRVFFDKYLKGVAAPLLDGPASRYPEVSFRSHSQARSETLVEQDGIGLMVISNGTVVDGLGSRPIPDGLVVIDGERILFVGPEVDFSVPPEAQIIDARGGTILPGIIDAHVHSTSDPALRQQFLMGGVTAVCDLGSTPEEMPQFADEYLDERPVAHGFYAGPIITAPGGLPDAVLGTVLNHEVATPDEARAAVTELRDRGADMVKVYLQRESNGVAYPMLGEEELAAIVAEAHTLGLPVRAHVTYASLLDMAVAAGVDTIEHVPVSLTRTEVESLSEAQQRRALESDDPLQLYFAELYPQYEAELERMVDAGIIMIPTLDRVLGVAFRASDRTPEQELAIAVSLGVVGRFHELGGVVALGTDYNVDIGMTAGMPLAEMEVLLAAGLTETEVIEAGTRHAATACGSAGDLGTLEAGKLADIVVVAGDPLQELEAIDDLLLVIKGGEIARDAGRIATIQE